MDLPILNSVRRSQKSLLYWIFLRLIRPFLSILSSFLSLAICSTALCLQRSVRHQTLKRIHSNSCCRLVNPFLSHTLLCSTPGAARTAHSWLSAVLFLFSRRFCCSPRLRLRTFLFV